MDANPRLWMRRELSPGRFAWLGFERPSRIIQSSRCDGVLSALTDVEAAAASGAWAAGYVAYEAAPGLDPALTVRSPKDLPLLWFGVFEEPEVVEGPLPPCCEGVGGGDQGLTWEPSLDEGAFLRSMGAIRRYLTAGDTYQVNFTFRMRAHAPVSVESLFASMVRSQTSPYSAFLDTGRHVFLSVSPEMFFLLDGDRLTCRPMKGTARRGMTVPADDAAARALASSAKNRSENVMIVDMIRNDLGRVAEAGSVVVESLFDVERYETVLQMTSTVTARSSAALPDVMRALFPCASVTGAPKRRTMEIIAALEDAPRGIYTGAVGFYGPGRKAQFSVAIRTVHIDRNDDVAEYGTGSGVVWDSDPSGEYAECIDKARVLFEKPEPFRLLETMLWTPARGVWLLREHMLRLLGSAGYFGFKAEEEAIRRRIGDATSRLPSCSHRVRLLLDRDGWIDIEVSPLGCRERRERTVVLAASPVSAEDRFLYHKTTLRRTYESAMASAVVGADDVLLWNEAGEVTETTIASVVFRRGGRWVTPPVRCGLLAGTLRRRLLQRGCVTEEVVPMDSVKDGEVFWLANSLRGLMRARLRR